MKKLIISLCAILTLALASPVLALDNVGGGGGVIMMAEKGQSPAFGYYIEGKFPWGVNAKSIDLDTKDTTITFEIVTGVQMLYSDFAYGKYAETEAEVILNGAQKSLGFLNSYLGGGVSVWHFRGSGTVDGEAGIGNTTRDGYFAKFTMDPFTDFTVDLGGHIIPITDGNDTYAASLGLRYTF